MFGRRSKLDASPPFQTVVRPAVDAATQNRTDDPVAESTREMSADDLEAAYLRALDAAESAVTLTESVTESPCDVVPAPAAAAEEPVDSGESPQSPSATEDAAHVPEPDRVTPRQIVEALLFVGGRPLTSRQLADVLGGSSTPEVADDLVSGLNAEYHQQQRPYEVVLGAGGYRLDLKPSFDKVRARVFGYGPREVKLPQNALEVLALVAYQQPVSRDDVEESGVPGAGGLLRQLLRRQLVVLQRGQGDSTDVYRTTDRFLELFGLSSLSDLPRPESVDQR